MQRGRSGEPDIVRQRLARLARPAPASGPEPIVAPPEPVSAPEEVPEPVLAGAAAGRQQWGIGAPTPAATPRWLDPTSWDVEPDADDFALTDLGDEWDDDGQHDEPGHRWQTLPPAAIALVGVGVVAALIAAYLALRAPANPVPVVDFPASAGPTASRSPREPAKPPVAADPIVVSVVGLVHRPGLVRMPPQSRVADAIRRAGGHLAGADLLSLNLARPLRDGDQVIVGLARGPGRPGLRSAVIGVDGAPSAPGAPADAGPGTAAPSGGKIDLNTATEQQLDGLPGVGPVTAKAIVDWRTAHGRFTSVDQLTEVDGIGPARLQRLRDLVTVGS
ncbi:MAG: ComEA family DNA-binding protein [Gordonia sp. (in: high G+C Gram-positive bacteria)]|uniref:helix-hairpin-helix domain-containing protein n=1 Tax=Gordonia sp. (in: high G+C Gram-positive bacteria) TaxID=84139 RepID=UPI0039E28F4E